MSSPLPPHLSEAIRERIAVLREAWHLDEAPSRPRLNGYPTFPRRPTDDARSLS
jgi:hypothetical protein